MDVGYDIFLFVQRCQELRTGWRYMSERLGTVTKNESEVRRQCLIIVQEVV